jgi:hypothetical protein
MVVVGRKDTDGQDWQLAQEAAVSGLRLPSDLEIRLRLSGLCPGPRSQPVAIEAYDESVYQVPRFELAGPRRVLRCQCGVRHTVCLLDP